MAKYYVESGTLRLVVQAEDPRRAALWAVHRCLQQVLPMLDASEEPDDGAYPTGADPRPCQPPRVCQQLGDAIQLHEQGFGASGGVRFATFDVVTEWNQLMVALARLEAMTD